LNDNIIQLGVQPRRKTFPPAGLRNFLAPRAICRFNFRRMKQKAYAAAGVDIDLADCSRST
jgi:hypothetical protein